MNIQRRIDNPTLLDEDFIHTEIQQGSDIIVQFSSQIYSKSMLADIDRLSRQYDSSFGVRFYSHGKGGFDCAVLKSIPNIKSLWIDSLLWVENVSEIGNLRNLKHLSFGPFEYADPHFLQFKNLWSLESLILGETRKRNIDLDGLQHFNKLNYLILCGHTKNIQAIGQLPVLRSLSLNSISKTPLLFVNQLTRLQKLRIILGGRENLEDIVRSPVETLEIIRVRGFSSLSNLSAFTSLKTLSIEDQIKLEKLVIPEQVKNIELLKILNCKTFKKLEGLQNLKTLRELRIYQTAMHFEDFSLKELPKSLKIFSFCTGRSKIDDEIGIKLKSLGFKNGLE